MAHPIGSTVGPTGRARLQVYLPADLRDRLAREAFERHVAVSTLIEEGARLVLARAGASEATEPPADQGRP